MGFEEHEMDLSEADRRYAELKRRHDAGALEDGEFDARLQELMVQDGEGRWWAKSRDTGEWHYHDGNDWVRGTLSQKAGEDRTPSAEDDGRWRRLVEECVEVLDELDGHMGDFDAPRREIASHVILRLEEILERSGVEVISADSAFDRLRHKSVPTDGIVAAGAAIVETLSPGFALEGRVLRRARVRLG